MARATSAQEDPRAALVHSRRAEERIVCSVLHASSPFGIIAMISSAGVWAAQRTRSRFVAFQALQAALFQLTGLLALALTFAIFAVGFYFAAFTGMIARTGVDDPQLTEALIAAFIVCFVSISFFQWVYPLIGLVAAFRLLRGHDFRYPLLAAIASRWIAHGPAQVVAAPESSTFAEGPYLGEPALAGIAQLSILAGLSPILAPILWATAKKRSRFLSQHLLQAPVLQIALAGASAAWFVAAWGLILFTGLVQSQLSPEFQAGIQELSSSPFLFFAWLAGFAALFLLAGGLAIRAAFSAFKGSRFRYPLIGDWLSTYMSP